jgi:hypothetical protein
MRTWIVPAGLAALLIGFGAPASAQQQFGFDPDTNGDGKITVGEMKTMRMNRMMEADADHDGKVSKAEYETAMKARIAQFQARGGPPGGGAGRPGGPRPGGPRRDQFKETDLNSDGFVTKAEVERAVIAQFAKLDKDKKGYVTREEMFAAFRPGAAAAAPAKKAGG